MLLQLSYTGMLTSCWPQGLLGKHAWTRSIRWEVPKKKNSTIIKWTTVHTLQIDCKLSFVFLFFFTAALFVWIKTKRLLNGAPRLQSQQEQKLLCFTWSVAATWMLFKPEIQYFSCKHKFFLCIFFCLTVERHRVRLSTSAGETSDYINASYVAVRKNPNHTKSNEMH